MAVVNSVCFWLPFNGDQAGELELQWFWQQTRQSSLKPPQILLPSSLHLYNDFPFQRTMSLWGIQEFTWESDKFCVSEPYPPKHHDIVRGSLFFFSVVTHYFNIETKKLKLLILKNIMTVNVLVKYICHWLVLIFNFKYLHFRIFNGKYCQQHQSTSCCW